MPVSYPLSRILVKLTSPALLALGLFFIALTERVVAQEAPKPYLAEDVQSEASNGECPRGTSLVCQDDLDFTKDWKRVATTHVTGIKWSKDYSGQSVCTCLQTPIRCPTSYSEITGDSYKGAYANATEQKKAEMDSSVGYKLQCFLNLKAKKDANSGSYMAAHFHDYGSASHFKKWVKNLVFNRKDDLEDYPCVCGVYRGNGCFAPESQLTLADGSQKRADKIAAGDKLWNPVSKKGVTVLKVVEGPEEKPLYKIGYRSGENKESYTIVSSEHPVLTKNGVRKAKELELGEIIYDQQNSEQILAIYEQQPVTDGQYVVNFVTDQSETEIGRHLLLSGGIITGDLVLQNELRD